MAVSGRKPSPSSSEGAAEPPRGEVVSVDFEDVEEIPSSFEDVSDAIDVEFDDAASVDKLLAMTGENWSIEEQRATLKEAARDRDDRKDTPPIAKPDLILPTPFDLGPSEREALAPRSAPPPLPVSKSSLPPPLPQEATGTASRRPPPLPSRSSASAPPASGGAATGFAPPSPTVPPSRRPPPLPKGEGTMSGIAPSRPPAVAAVAATPQAPPAPPTPKATPEGAALVELLTTRIARLESEEDRVGLARAHVELSIVHETMGDETLVNAEAEHALKVDPDMAPAHAILRRRLHGRTQLVPMLRHLECEIASASSEATAVELFAQRARLFEAGDRPDDAREAWELALAHAPNHSAALKGLEADLFRRAFSPSPPEDAWEDLIAHLGQMADAYSSQPGLAAWLHVERARILETQLGRIDAARGAYERALRLDPGTGPVRDACTTFAAAHHDLARLAALLADEARLETTSERCARLELDAACILHGLLGDDARAIALLERAAARAPTTASVDRRVLDDLVALYERSAAWPEAMRSRRSRLRFFTDHAALVYELRSIASTEEKLGNVDVAIADLERAIGLDPEDPTLLEEIDRLLAMARRDEERILLWAAEAQRVDEGPKRARALAKAAQLAEGIGRHEEAVRHLRAAWVAAPGDSEILDQLSRLMSPAASETFDRQVRALIELYSQAAQATRDDGRRVAYLEKVATLWEELVGDPQRAARAYEEILRVEPGRRGAVLGLERNAGRVGDDRALSRALFEEAKFADDGAEVLALRVRSAQVLARVDAPRALSLVQEVLEQDPQHVAARTLETRLHEEGGRWEQAAASLRARIEIAPTTKERVSLWLALAHVQDTRLRSPKDAIQSLQTARTADPAHPVPPEEIARILEATGDARALRSAIEAMARDAITPQERARHLTRAGEIDELRLDDDVSAAKMYGEALVETPDDELVAERLLRVLARRLITTGGAGARQFETPAFDELVSATTKRAEKASTPARALDFSIQLASLLIEAKRDLPRAMRVLESALVDEPRNVAALRRLETIARLQGNPQSQVRILRMQSDGFSDVRARIGALWEIAGLENWRLAAGESLSTYTRILELDPTDPSGLEAAVRLSLGPARRGDSSARRAAVSALRSLCALAGDESLRLATELRLALLLEQLGQERSDQEASLATREALERLRELLAMDPLSVTAATTLARLANRLGDAAGAAAAAISLAELSIQPRARAKYLGDAASLLLSEADDAALGTTTERNERAAALLEKALEADPNSTFAALRLSQLRTAQNRGERLVDVFRGALAKASHRDAIVLLGSEIARVARDDIGDLGVAIEAMRRVREAAPEHVPSLLTLSELFIAQRAWPEAVEALEDVVARGKEASPRITALFALASVYEKILTRPADAERALRKALLIDEQNPRAIRALIHRLAAKQNEVDEEGRPQSKVNAKLEIASLLERLAHAEKDRRVKCDIFLELADIRIGLKDPAQAEKALVEAVALVPDHPRAFGRLTRFFRLSPQGAMDAVSYARALGAVIARGQQLGNHDPRWYATLGHIEVVQLSRLRDGVQHLSRAVQMAPALDEVRYELALAHSRLGSHDEAAKTVMTMITPSARPLVAIRDPGKALDILERAMTAERRPEEAIVVSELRAIAGHLDEGRHNWLRSRRLAAFESHHVALDRATLIGHVVPPEGRHVLLEVAATIAGVEAKLLRAEIAELGISTRDRIGKRSGNPTRALLDRLARALALSDIELVVTPNVNRTRVLTQDVPWIVVPKALTELPEPTQLASMSRALARVALNVPWLEELPPAHIEALLVAAVRVVMPMYGKDEVDVLSQKLVTQYEPNFTRELSRKQKQALEKLVPVLGSPHGRPIGLEVLIGALARAELRIAYLLTGDVLASIDELRGLDATFLHATESPGRASLGAVLDHPFAGDVVRFALTTEATALRRRVGATWAS